MTDAAVFSDEQVRAAAKALREAAGLYDDPTPMMDAALAALQAAAAVKPIILLEVRIAIAEEAALSWQSKANAAEFRATLCWNDLLAAREALEPFAVEGRKIPYEVRDDEAWKMIDFMPLHLRRAARLTQVE